MRGGAERGGRAAHPPSLWRIVIVIDDRDSQHDLVRHREHRRERRFGAEHRAGIASPRESTRADGRAVSRVLGGGARRGAVRPHLAAALHLRVDREWEAGPIRRAGAAERMLRRRAPGWRSVGSGLRRQAVLTRWRHRGGPPEEQRDGCDEQADARQGDHAEATATRRRTTRCSRSPGRRVRTDATGRTNGHADHGRAPATRIALVPFSPTSVADP